MSSPEMAAETLRRLEHFVNKPLSKKQRHFSTPYEGFVRPHNKTINKLVIDAIAVPAGISKTMLPTGWENKTWCFQDDLVKIYPLQWPYNIAKARIIDTENQLWAFELSSLYEINHSSDDQPHVRISPSNALVDVPYQWINDLPSDVLAKMIQTQFGNNRRSSALTQMVATTVTQYRHAMITTKSVSTGTLKGTVHSLHIIVFSTRSKKPF